MSARPAVLEPAEVIVLVQDEDRYHHDTIEVRLEDLQEAHERMHPEGSYSIEKCWEPICRHLRGAA